MVMMITVVGILSTMARIGSTREPLRIFPVSGAMARGMFPVGLLFFGRSFFPFFDHDPPQRSSIGRDLQSFHNVSELFLELAL